MVKQAGHHAYDYQEYSTMHNLLDVCRLSVHRWDVHIHLDNGITKVGLNYFERTKGSA